MKCWRCDIVDGDLRVTAMGNLTAKPYCDSCWVAGEPAASSYRSSRLPRPATRATLMTSNRAREHEALEDDYSEDAGPDDVCHDNTEPSVETAESIRKRLGRLPGAKL